MVMEFGFALFLIKCVLGDTIYHYCQFYHTNVLHRGKNLLGTSLTPSEPLETGKARKII